LQDDIEKTVSKLEERIKNLEEGSCMDAIIFPLHASLPAEMQARIIYVCFIYFHHSQDIVVSI